LLVRGARRVCWIQPASPGVGESGLALEIPRFEAAHRTTLIRRRSRPCGSARRSNARRAFQQLRCPKSTGSGAQGRPHRGSGATGRQRPAPAQQINCRKPASSGRPTPSPQPVPPVLRDRASRNKEGLCEDASGPWGDLAALAWWESVWAGGFWAAPVAPSDTQVRRYPLQSSPPACHPPRWTNASSCSIA